MTYSNYKKIFDRIVKENEKDNSNPSFIKDNLVPELSELQENIRTEINENAKKMVELDSKNANLYFLQTKITDLFKI